MVTNCFVKAFYFRCDIIAGLFKFAYDFYT